MILQALCDYYQRNADLPRLGFETKAIPFVIEINAAGELVQIADTRALDGKKKVARNFLVPKEQERSGKNAWQKPNLLWDHYGYLLGHPKTDKENDVEMAAKQHQAFISQVKELQKENSADTALRAVLNFLEAGNFEKVFSHPAWEDCKKIPNCNMSFRIAGSIELVCQTESVKSFLAAKLSCEMANEDDESDIKIPALEAQCLISGEIGKVARLHPRTPVEGSKSNAKLVSFQKDSGFDSYGKQQSYNAPVSEKAVFAYTTALNFLLSRDSKQRIRVGDTSTVFWSEKRTDFEDSFADFFDEPPKDDPAKQTRAVVSLFSAVQAGAFNDEGQKTRFYVLGLSPNAARISVRFWQVGTVAEMAARVCQHFKDVEIVHAAFEKPHLSLFRLLVSTAMQGKSENIPPNLAGETMRAILQGSPYPQTLLQAVIRRLRAEQAKKDDQTGKAIPNVSYPRAALIKACINRQIRHSLSSEKELIVSLDPTNTNTAYRLGRLFAVFERMQESAYERELNRTIRDTFFGAAMSTPRSVFPRLIRLNQHHLRNIKRSKPKSAGYFDGLLREINWGFNPTSAYPVVFQLEDQGRFAIGYYHQRQAFFKNSESTIQGA